MIKKETQPIPISSDEEYDGPPDISEMSDSEGEEPYYAECLNETNCHHLYPDMHYPYHLLPLHRVDGPLNFRRTCRNCLPAIIKAYPNLINIRNINAYKVLIDAKTRRALQRQWDKKKPTTSERSTPTKIAKPNKQGNKSGTESVRKTVKRAMPDEIHIAKSDEIEVSNIHRPEISIKEVPGNKKLKQSIPNTHNITSKPTMANTSPVLIDLTAESDEIEQPKINIGMVSVNKATNKNIPNTRNSISQSIMANTSPVKIEPDVKPSITNKGVLVNENNTPTDIKYNPYVNQISDKKKCILKKPTLILKASETISPTSHVAKRATTEILQPNNEPVTCWVQAIKLMKQEPK